MFLNKDSKISIIVSPCASETESFAARELAKYLNIIFGLKSNIISDKSIADDIVFILGEPENNIA